MRDSLGPFADEIIAGINTGKQDELTALRARVAELEGALAGLAAAVERNMNELFGGDYTAGYLAAAVDRAEEVIAREQIDAAHDALERTQP